MALGAASTEEAFDPKTQVGVSAPLGFFDPLGICPEDETTFNEYRASEIKHGRVAMMAIAGAVTQHFVRFPGFESTNFGTPLPAGFGAALYSPSCYGFMLLVVILFGVETRLWNERVEYQSQKWTQEPGNFDNPLGVGSYSDDMRTKELNNGRIAMFAIIGLISAEAVTGMDAAQQMNL